MIGQVENERFKNIFQSGDGFLQSNNTAWTLVIVLAVAFGFTLLVILKMRRSRWRTEGVTSADEDIFRLMCNANSLTPHQIYALRDMFFDLKGGNPVALFTCPQLYDEYLTEVTGRRKALIESVRDIVFAAPKKSVKLTTQITRKILGEKPAMPDQPTESRN